MSQIDTVFRWLARDESPEANAVLAAALEHAEPPYAGRIARILSGRRHETAWAGLVAHYDRLSPEIQEQLAAQPERLRAGIAAALKSPASRVRRNALKVMAEHPQPQLADAAADALRDGDQEVVTAAAEALRGMAEPLVDADGASDRSDRGPPTAECVAFVRGMREAVRTFELHRRAEVLETCLWFAKYLAADLWAALSDPHSSSGRVVAQRLKDWDHPRLAGFLLLALGQPTWREAARGLLDLWSTRDHLLSILRQTDLLADPGVRRGLRQIKQPVWLGAVGPDLAELPAAARAQVPLWVCHLGLKDELRLRMLTRWLVLPLPEVQRATVYALALLDTPETHQLLLGVAQRAGPMRTFARWFMIGQRALAQSHRWARSSQAGQPSGSLPEAAT